MNWYYVEAGEQVGPVTDAQLAQLFSAHKINDETLVWREGMADWVPYRNVKAEVVGGLPDIPPPLPVVGAIAGAGEAVCAECGRIFPVGETIRYGALNICAGCKPVFLQKLAEGGTLPTGQLNYARIITRFLAVFLDGMLLGVMNFGLGIVVGFLGGRAAGRQSTALMGVQFILMAINILIALSYETFFIGKYGATLGKMACKIKVVTADGGKVSYGRAFGRYFAKMLSAFTCMIGYIIACFDDQRRALHDHICNTRVVYK